APTSTSGMVKRWSVYASAGADEELQSTVRTASSLSATHTPTHGISSWGACSASRSFAPLNASAAPFVGAASSTFANIATTAVPASTSSDTKLSSSPSSVPSITVGASGSDDGTTTVGSGSAF